jgi:hypothetical protein
MNQLRYNPHGKTPADQLQPAMKYTEIAKTPQEFMKKLNNAKVTPATPAEMKQGIAAHIKF